MSKDDLGQTEPPLPGRDRSHNVTEREEFEAWAKEALGFWIDDEDIRVLNYVSGGCVPANSTEIAMWDALRAGRRTTPDREAIIEECAKVCDDNANQHWYAEDTAREGCEVCAERIRFLKTAPNGEKG